MSNKKSTKRALLLSVLSLVLCFTMLLGTTFAWFTDSVTSGANIIQSGNLKVLMDWADATEALDTQDWKDASSDPIFNYGLWEPGYVDAKHIKITNDGSLALKFKMFIQPDGKVEDLAEVIDVYIIEGGEQLNGRASLAGKTPVGTLADVIESFELHTYGELEAGKSKIFTVALMMRTDAGNEYENKKIGSSFAIKVIATQLDSELDSFGKDYDENTVVANINATPETAQELIYAAKAGDVIALNAGVYDKLVISEANGDAKDGITLVGASGAVVGVMDLHRSHNIKLMNIEFDAAKTAYSISSKTGVVRTQHGNIIDLSTGTDSKGSNMGAYNITVSGCTFKGTASDVENYVPICFYEQGRASGPAHDFTIVDCDFAVDAQQYLGLNYLEGGVVTVKGNTFGSAANKTYHNAINATTNGSSWVVTDNVFYNWNPSNALFGSSYGGNTKVTINVSGNELNNVYTPSFNVFNIKNNTYNATNLDLSYADNVINGGLYAINDTPVVDGNDNLYKAELKAGNTVVGSKAELDSALANGDNAVLSGDVSTGGDFTAADTNIVLGGNTITMTGSDQTVSGNVNISGGKVDVSSGYFDLRPSDEAAVVFEDVVFESTKKEKTNGNSTNRVESAFEFCPIDLDAEGTFIFRNCTFINANAVFEAMSGTPGKVSVVFENCTFNLFGNSEAISIANYLTIDITIRDCTFDFTATSNVHVVEAMTSSNVTVTFEGNNVVNGVAAEPTTDPSLVGTADEVKVFTTQSVKICFSVDTVNGLDTITVSGIATK